MGAENLIEFSGTTTGTWTDVGLDSEPRDGPWLSLAVFDEKTVSPASSLKFFCLWGAEAGAPL